jgi:hypothetical protein
MRREIYGPRSERKARLIDQMELELEELEAAAAEDELARRRPPRAARRRFAPSRAEGPLASRFRRICRANG